MAESVSIDVEESENHPLQGTGVADGFFNQKVINLERFVLVMNFILELPAAVFDQLSSEHKPRYALLSMIMSFIMLFISIFDLVYKGRKGRVAWRIRGKMPWFYYPYPNPKPFGTFPDIIGLACSIFQCIFTSITYSFLSRGASNPININVWPVTFAFGLLCARFSGNPPEKMLTSLERRLQEFSLAELAAATNSFSPENRIGPLSFRIFVYRGELADGHQVTIKRAKANTGQWRKEFQKEFESELTLLSRLHHKNLVRLVGYCEDGDEILLVHEYMKNGSLYKHLHDENNIEKNSSMINSWKMRIKIALDAARGIEYLHNYASPPIIHRDVKSSNILLDENWTSRVSAFVFSLMCHEPESECMPMEMVGTPGYIDPEYYDLTVLTTKSDVYSLGVVLLELLTGKTATFWDVNEGNGTSLVHFAKHKMKSEKLPKLLDSRVNPPRPFEVEAVELLADTALACVALQGKDRPNITDIVANLERASTLMEARAWSLSGSS